MGGGVSKDGETETVGAKGERGTGSASTAIDSGDSRVGIAISSEDPCT